MIRKSDKQFLFETQVNWLSETKGIVTSNEVSGALQVSTPEVFGGKGKSWSPEHLFLASVGSCFMTTYLYHARKMNFEIAKFECNSIGHLESTEGPLRFTRIHLYPQITVSDEGLLAPAAQALEKTQKSCIISASVNAALFYHPQIVVLPATVAMPAATGIIRNISPDLPGINRTK